MEEMIKAMKVVKEAREIDKELIEKLPPAQRYQFARVRDDITIGENN